MKQKMKLLVVGIALGIICYAVFADLLGLGALVTAYYYFTSRNLLAESKVVS